MKYTAIFRETKNGLYRDMTTNDYSNKKMFEKDLRANGYMVACVLTDEQIKKIQERDPEIIFKFSERICEYVIGCID